MREGLKKVISDKSISDEVLNDIMDFEMNYDCNIINLEKSYRDEDAWYWAADFEVKDALGNIKGVYVDVTIPYSSVDLSDGRGFNISKVDKEIYYSRKYFSIDELKLLSEYTSFKQVHDYSNDRDIFTDSSGKKVYYRRYKKFEGNSYEFPKKTLNGIKYESIPEKVEKHIDEYLKLNKFRDLYLLDVQQNQENEYRLYYAFVTFDNELYGFKKAVYNVNQKGSNGSFYSFMGEDFQDFFDKYDVNDTEIIGLCHVKRLKEIIGL